MSARAPVQISTATEHEPRVPETEWNPEHQKDRAVHREVVGSSPT
jgi:hypothetical protein